MPTMLTLIRLVSTTCFNCKATPTKDINYSCFRTCLAKYMGSLSCHITALVITSLRGGHTHTDTHTQFTDKINL